MFANVLSRQMFARPLSKTPVQAYACMNLKILTASCTVYCTIPTVSDIVVLIVVLIVVRTIRIIII